MISVDTSALIAIVGNEPMAHMRSAGRCRTSKTRALPAKPLLRGEQLVKHAVNGIIELLRDVARFDVDAFR